MVCSKASWTLRGADWIASVSSDIWVLSNSVTSKVSKISVACSSVMTANTSGLVARASAWSAVTAVARIWVMSATASSGARFSIVSTTVSNCSSVRGMSVSPASRRASTSSGGNSAITSIGSVSSVSGASGRVSGGRGIVSGGSGIVSGGGGIVSTTSRMMSTISGGSSKVSGGKLSISGGKTMVSGGKGIVSTTSKIGSGTTSGLG